MLVTSEFMKLLARIFILAIAAVAQWAVAQETTPGNPLKLPILKSSNPPFFYRCITNENIHTVGAESRTREGTFIKKAPYGGIDLELNTYGGPQAGNLVSIQPLLLSETGEVLGPRVTSMGIPINDKLGLVATMGTKSYLYLQINETEENENLPRSYLDIDYAGSIFWRGPYATYRFNIKKDCKLHSP